MEAHIERRARAPTTITMLYEAIIKGGLPFFTKLLRDDPFIVDRSIIENSSTGFNQSPLHVAADMGHMEMVKSLIDMRPSMCLARDQDGRNPIHVAAIKGHVDVVQELHEANPHAAQKKTNDGETILHLCIKHYQLKALEVMVKLTEEDGAQLLNSMDINGDTVLHLAVSSKQPEMTAVDIHLKQSRKNSGDEKIGQSLKIAKAKPAKHALNQQANDTWLEKQRTSLMVVASLIATMAFQVGINPPGGVWQDNENDHSAGASIWSYRSKVSFGFNVILVCNTIALTSSLSVILLLISGLPCTRYFLFGLRIILWITVTATTFTYLFAIGNLTHHAFAAFWRLLCGCLMGCLLLMGIICLGNAMRFIFKLLGWQRMESIRRFGNKFFT
ncbi:Ankyrin repeat-containing protein BDA1, partial [Bienertia sinuspersici]